MPVVYKEIHGHASERFRPGHDIIIGVGTANPQMTVDPNHRSRLLSALVIQPGQILSTREIIPVESWQKSVRDFGSARWAHAMAVTRACIMVGPPFPHAHDVVPTAYAQTGQYENRGSLVEAKGAERKAVMDVDIVEIQLHLRSGV